MTEQIFFDNPHYSEFVTTTAGEPFRLLPIGTLVKDGKERTLTKEILARFKLPHFKPAIKLGSHADETPAGGHIVGLEVRDDGLYAIPELTDRGLGALDDGSFRYHSPEILWEGGMEDPTSGKLIEGPLIVGDALLHMPHLGEQAALYTITKTGEKTMTDTVSVPASWLDRLLDMFSSNQQKPDAPPEVPAGDDIEKYEAQIAERETQIQRLEAQVAEYEAEALREKQVAHYAAALKETPLAEDAELHELLTDLDKEKAEKLLTVFKAIGAQAEQAHLEDEIGHSGEPEGAGDPVAALDTLVKGKMAQDNIDYNAAIRIVQTEKPELVMEALTRRRVK